MSSRNGSGRIGQKAFLLVVGVTAMALAIAAFDWMRSNRTDDRRVDLPNAETSSSAQRKRPIARPRDAVPQAATPRSTAYARPLENQYSVGDPAALFDAHIGKAESGSVPSMLVIADTIRSCVMTGPYSNWEQFKASDLYQSGSLAPDHEAALKALIDDVGPACAYVNAKIPPQQRDHFTWSNHWYYRAANEGSPVAKLELSLQQPPDTDDIPAVAEMLDLSYASGEARTFYYASRLYAYIENDARNLTGRMWAYLGCMNHEECSTEGMRTELEAELVPADVDLVTRTAARIDEHRPPIDFRSLPTIDELSECLELAALGWQGGPIDSCRNFP